ncbi:MAG: hypothetical protein K0B15_03970 [Lentimicrobium sp.]|nr:hypothetical protein [Lentimicrobium sp.]
MMKVIGVVKDFNYTSMHNKVEPIIFFIPEFPMNLLYIRLKPGAGETTVEFIREKWIEHGANRPFDYYFLDKDYESKYAAESKLRKVFIIFAILSIFIALLGLFGLSSFTTMKRTKEIGIRKVLGTSVGLIAGMFYKESVLLVIAAFAVSTPLSWYFLIKWLENFACHPPPWMVYVFFVGNVSLTCSNSVSKFPLFACSRLQSC